MKPFDSMDLIIAGITGYILGMLLGLLINYKRLKSLNELLEYERDEAESSYTYLLDKYIELRILHSNSKVSKSTKRKPGRPKGTKNKLGSKKPGPKTKK